MQSHLLIDGREYPVDDLVVTTYVDDPRLKRGREDGRRRPKTRVTKIVNHSTKGIPGGGNRTPQRLREGGVDRGKEFDVAKFWSTSPGSSGAHTVVDTDGSVGQVADLQLVMMFHATVVNETSVGNELFQLADGSLYEETVHAGVRLVKHQCLAFGIPMQLHHPYRGPVDRLMDGGRDCYGVFGHRDITHRRGPGDPGDLLINLLIAEGFEVFDFSAGEDRRVWAKRQRELGVLEDGLPGPITMQALRERGFAHGQWALGEGSFNQCNGCCPVHCPED